MSSRPTFAQSQFRFRDLDFPPSVEITDGRAVVTFSVGGVIGRTRPSRPTTRFVRRIVEAQQAAAEPAQPTEDPAVVENLEAQVRTFVNTPRAEPIPNTGNVDDLRRRLAQPENELSFDHTAAGTPTGRQILRALAPFALQKRLVLSVESSDGQTTHYTLSERNISAIQDALRSRVSTDQSGIFGSDAELVRVLTSSPVRTTIKHARVGRRLNGGRGREATSPGGAFFRWNLLPGVDQTLKDFCHRLGIFTKAGQTEHYKLQAEKKEKKVGVIKPTENCIIRALREAGLPTEKLAQLRVMCRNRLIPVAKLKDFADRVGIQIHLQRDTPEGDRVRKRTQKIGRKSDVIYTIGCLDSHYFAVLPTPFSSFAIRNYESLRGEPEWWDIIKRRASGSYRRDPSRKIDSFALVKLLLDKKDTMLDPVLFSPELCSTAFYDKATELTTLHYDEKSVREVKKGGGPKLSPEKRAEYESDLTKLFETHEMTDLQMIERWGSRCAADLEKRLRASGVEFQNGVNELESRKKARVFYDFETYGKEVKRRGGRKRIHVPFIVCADIEDYGPVSFYGRDCAKQLLEKLAYVRTYAKRRGGYTLIAHNANYDFRFLAEHVSIKTYNPFGGFLKATARYYPETAANQHYDADFKCSWKIIPMPLGQFGACFGLEQEKDVFPYSLCSEETLEKQWVPLPDAQAHLHKSGEFAQITENVKRLGMTREVNGVTEFDLRAYANHYCALDVQVLKQGYMTFRKWILDSFDVDIDGVLTIPSLADKVMKSKKVYEDVCEVGNIPRAFLQQFVCGGRVMVGHSQKRHINPSLKKRWTRSAIKKADGLTTAVLAKAESLAGSRVAGHHVDKAVRMVDEPPGVSEASSTAQPSPCGSGAPRKWDSLNGWGKGEEFVDRLADFDGVSLYPSSMKRLADDLGGYLKGRPKVIGPDQLNMDFLGSVDGFFVELVVTKVGKAREFPLINHRETAQSSRLYRNDLVGKTLFLDRIGLEDAIQFQGLEFDLVRGYYFDEGRNPTIGSVIQHFFMARLEKKSQGNPIQIVYKLLMNASYGRTLLKPIEATADIYNTEKDYQRQISYNYNSIKSVQQIPGGKYLLKKWAPIDKHYNQVHIGCEVLSMSKRIMAEVMCTAEDLGMRIDYTDTDSMHIAERHLPELERAYREKYGRELVGKMLGQFHTDFDVHEARLDSNGKRMGSGAGIKCSHISAVESLFIAKKCYIDRLEGVRKDNGEIVTDYHIRMKGVTTQAIWYRLHTRPAGAPTTEPETFEDPIELYRYLFDGNEVSFDLTCDQTKASFDMSQGLSIYDRSEFIRRVSFKDGEQVVL